ncbi:MAG: hypothetical protein JWN57_111 [Frankiales bacterium]|jgi:hypothetical protein|nr:hypothetical protein [Frankiales bacterium]
MTVREDTVRGVVAQLAREVPQAAGSQVEEAVGFWCRMLAPDVSAEELADRARESLRLWLDLSGPQPSGVEWEEQVAGNLPAAMARLDELTAAGWLVLSVSALTEARDCWLLRLAAPL